MKTAIQHLIYSFEPIRMQSTYSKEQILNLLNFMLEMEKQQIIDAWFGGYLNGESKTELKSEQYYNETFKSE